MDGFNVVKILAGLMNPELYLRKVKQNNIKQGDTSFNSAFSQGRPNVDIKNPINNLVINNQLQMNQLAGMDRSIYVKNILGLPPTLGAILLSAQSTTPLSANTLIPANFDEEALMNKEALSKIFSDNDDLLIENLQKQTINNVKQAANLSKDTASLVFSGMIHLPTISNMVLKNSKNAVAGLIIAMASASKHGMTNEQINETLGIINSCVAMAESGNSAQTLKSLMLLYLPWLPLNEGVGFDIEIEPDTGENESNNSKLTVLIQTKNYGNVKGVFTLTTTNSVDIYIICSEDFPKTILLKSLNNEASSHAMTTKIDIEPIQQKSTELTQKQEAKVNLSATNEMNPYLLLIAHAFIRNTIYLDSNSNITETDNAI